MQVLLATLVIFGVVMIAMAIGYIFMKKPIKGSCGGLSTMSDIGLTGPCEICGEDPKTCKKKKITTTA